MSTKYIVNNVTGQTITDLTVSGNLVISGSSNVLPYKVYTALLTQSGGDNVLTLSSGDSLVIGVTYEINDDSGNPDWTNVGAPNNNGGTYFVATGTTPNSWGNNAASLNYNTGAPVVTVLENTIGNIWFGFNFDGYYSCNSNGLFTNNKTTISISNLSGSLNTGDWALVHIVSVSTNYFDFFTIDSANRTNDFLLNTPIEIRIYN